MEQVIFCDFILIENESIEKKKCKTGLPIFRESVDCLDTFRQLIRTIWKEGKIERCNKTCRSVGR